MNNHRSHCPIAFALDVFGDRWTLLILRDILLKKKRYYSEFVAAEEKIATNILAARLAHLEKEDLITKSADETNRKKLIYRPTSKALDLIPLMMEMVKWSAKYDRKTAAPKEFVSRLGTNMNGVIKEFRQPFEEPSDCDRK